MATISSTASAARAERLRRRGAARSREQAVQQTKKQKTLAWLAKKWDCCPLPRQNTTLLCRKGALSGTDVLAAEYIRIQSQRQSLRIEAGPRREGRLWDVKPGLTDESFKAALTVARKFLILEQARKAQGAKAVTEPDSKDGEDEAPYEPEAVTEPDSKDGEDEAPHGSKATCIRSAAARCDFACEVRTHRWCSRCSLATR